MIQCKHMPSEKSMLSFIFTKSNAMKYILLLIAGAALSSFTMHNEKTVVITGTHVIKDTLPFQLPASFTDDYDIKYTISDSLWLQHPSAKYHIIRWNKEQQYLIARNGMDNKSEPGLYTRIDYMKFSGMAPYTWGFCLSVYNAASDSLAEFGPNKTDRANPRKGCNGYPFSRMKPAQ